MGTILRFEAQRQSAPRRVRREHAATCEIVIFPGVRIERHDPDRDLDLGHRLLDAAGHGDFDGIGGNDRPRKTS